MGTNLAHSFGLLTCRILLVLAVVDYVVQGITATNLEDPRIIEHPEDKYVAKNEPATLNCKAEGHPKPVITWYRNGRPVTTSSENPKSHRMLLPNGQLFFLSIKHSKNNKPDVGIYYCNATNPSTGKWVISRNASLEIAVLRDDFKSSPQDAKVAVGDSVTLECRPPRGLPEPRISWTKDSTPVQIGGRMAMENGANLIIMNAQKDDSGSYVCIASNMAGERESVPARLAVAEKPKLIKSPQDALKQENEEVEFACRATGDPVPTITWRREQGNIPPGRSFILGDKSLQIKRVKVEDEGAYVCRAENSVGYVEKVARLTVHSKPSFLVTPRNKVVGVGRTVTLRCQVSGNPPPAVFWNKEQSQTLMFPRSRQDHGRFSVLDEGTLIIQRARKSDAGEYMCQALSVAGSAMAKAKLTVKDIDPRPPPIIHQGPQNQTLVVKSVTMLPCNATGDPKPTIRWFKDGALIHEDNPRFTLLDSGTLQISDLKKSDTGLYTCRASSETGETTWSAALFIAMPSNPTVIFRRTPEPDTFPGPPSKPHVANVQERSLQLSWTPNRDHGASKVFAYMVEYFSHETEQGWTVASDNIRDTSYVVHNLRPDTSYMFLVRAQNQHGISLPSPVSEPVRTAGAGKYDVRPTMPEYPADVVADRLSGKIVVLQEAMPMTSTDVHVSWQVLKSQRFIEGFHILYRRMVSPHTHTQRRNSEKNRPYHHDYSTETIPGGQSTSYVVRNLEEYTWYEIKVQPFYDTTVGDDSNILKVRTKDTYPSAPPQKISARITNDGLLHLQWSPPPEDHFNGRLIEYKIYCFGNESRFDRNITVNATTHMIPVPNIIPDIRYKILMAVRNEFGQGPLSQAIYIGGDSRYGLMKGFVKEPWFIATLIGTIGGTLWFALCVFSIWLYRKRRARKKSVKSGATMIPVQKPDEQSRLGSYFNSPGYLHKDSVAPCDGYGPPQTDLAKSLHQHPKEEENLYNTPIITTPQMRTFYNKQNPMPSCAPYATTTLIAQNNYMNSKPLQGGDSAFRPINQGYVHQGSCSSDSCMKQENSSDSNTDNSQNQDMVHDCHEPLISPVSEVGNLTSDMAARRCKQATKNAVLNFADMLPPPPEHPPPSDAGSPPDSPPTGRHMHNNMSDRGSIHYHNAPQIVTLTNKGSIHSLRAPVYDGGGHHVLLSDSERVPNGNIYKEGQNGSVGSNSPHYRSLSPTAHQRICSQRCSSDVEGGPIRAYKLVPLNEHELAKHYSDTERGPTPPVRMLLHMGENGAAMVTDNMEDPVMDRACQSSLPSLINEPQLNAHNRLDNYENGHEVGGRQEGQSSGECDNEAVQRPNCLTPESNYGEVDSVTGSMLASWASVTDNSSCGSSARSSGVSSSDGSFFAEADFASAVAKAAELSGLTVVGSTVTDPHAGAKKKKNYRQRPKRPTSPYSTDSNFSATPHKPYPKSHRKKQLQDQASKYNNHPAMKPKPPTRAKVPNQPSLNSIPQNVSEFPSYNKPTFPSPTGHGTSKSPQSQLSNGSQTPTNSHAGDSDTTLRANPISLLESEETPVV